MNEPLVLRQAHCLFQEKSLDRDQQVKLIESTIKYYLQKPGVEFLLVTLDVLSFSLIEILPQINPQPLLVFCTRSPLSSITALTRVTFDIDAIYACYYAN